MRRNHIRSTLLFLAIFATSAHADGIPEYRPVVGWPAIPANIDLGAVSAVATDSKDRVYVFHRGKRPVLMLSKEGKFEGSWGDAELKTPHGLRIDRDDNVWVTDIGNHQVLKFDAGGKLLLSLGKKGEPGDAEDRFDRPTDIVIAPGGDFYVSDGYGNSRVLHFSRDGKLLGQWGKKGSGPSEFNLPHSIRLDADGKVYVADRENKRIQIFDARGKFLSQWTNVGSPYGLYLTKQGHMYVADGVNHWVLVVDREGKSLGRFGGQGKAPGQFDLPHMLCLDSQGAVYVAEVNGKRVQKLVGSRQ